ncbi:hypothetical protein HZA33_02795 [Candidatus Pacearchaeota archaeon]|nr:hypothetical protein [Candidatus Pacearchaeota archaeon]
MRNNLWAIVIVALVVSVIASLATLSLTGNIVKVATNKFGPPVYNTTEIDAKLKSISLGLGNFAKLNTCYTTTIDNEAMKNCTTACSSISTIRPYTCLFGIAYESAYNGANYGSTSLIDCASLYGAELATRYVTCLCCGSA